MKRVVTTCDRCRHEAEPGAVYHLASTPGNEECAQALLDLDLCGLCYSGIRDALDVFVRTEGAYVQLPVPLEGQS